MRERIDKARENHDYTRAHQLEAQLERLIAHVCSLPWAESIEHARPCARREDYPPRNDERILMRLSRARVRIGEGGRARHRWTPAAIVDWEDEADLTGDINHPPSCGSVVTWSAQRRGYIMPLPKD